jgi:hypothetical protein
LWTQELEANSTYTPFRDFNKRDFILVRLHDLLLVPIWMGGTHNDGVKDDQNEFFKMVRVQWWVPTKKGLNSNERCFYKNCYDDKWKCNLVDP